MLVRIGLVHYNSHLTNSIPVDDPSREIPVLQITGRLTTECGNFNLINKLKSISLQTSHSEYFLAFFLFGTQQMQNLSISLQIPSFDINSVALGEHFRAPGQLWHCERWR